MGRRHRLAIYAPSAFGTYESQALDPASGWGGAEFQAGTLAWGLAERGIEVAHIVYPLQSARPLPDSAPTVVQRAPHRSGPGPLGPFRELAAVTRALAEADADVYVVRKGGGHLIPAAAWCRVRGRGLALAISNDLDFVFDRDDRAGLVPGLYRRSLPHIDVAVAQTRKQEELAAPYVGSAEIELIPSFAEPMPEPAPQEQRDGFLWVSRLVDYKRPLSYLDLAESVPDQSFKMIGVPTNETDGGLADEVRRRAEALPNFELLEPRPREELLPMLDRIKALVSTSEYEGMPNVFLEAWGRGVPVLTLSFDPDGAIAEHGLGLNAGDDPERFAEQARSLAADPDLRSELGGRGREFVRGRHDPEQVLDRWQDLVERLASAGGR